MEIKDFLTEQWMNEYERKALVNLTDTSVQGPDAAWLLSKSPQALEGLELDYGYITGDPALRKEVLSLYQDQREETLTFAHGALQANTMIADILLSPGDHVITITPGYQQFADYPRHKGASVSEIALRDDWSIDLEGIREAITPATKMIFFANPSNPTGTWVHGKEMDALIDLCRKNDLWLVCDEVYLVPDQDAPSVSDLYGKSCVTGSLSKQYGLPGLRFGWIKGRPDLIEKINVYRDYTIISCGPLAEKMALIALHNRDEILTGAKAQIEKNKQIISEWLDSTDLFSCILPERGSVAFLKIPEGLSSKEFAVDLLEQTGIFFVPGSCFDKEGYVRLGLGRRIENLAGALERVEAFARQKLEETIN